MDKPNQKLEQDITPAPSWGNRLVGLEGLRGLAAFSVLIVHTAAETAEVASVSGGPFWTGVAQLRHGLTLFFVLSGFLLFRPFVTAVIAGKRRPPLARFWGNRALRIFPAYIVVLLITSYVLQTARLSSAGPTDRAEASGALNIVDLLWSLPMIQTFNPDQVRTGLGVAWSLTVELSFYLLLPAFGLLAVWLARVTGRRVLAAAAPVVLLFVVGFVGRAWNTLSTRGMTSEQFYEFNWGHNWDAVISRSILVQGDLFAFGMAVAVVYVCLEQGILKRERMTAYLSVAGLLLVTGIFLTIKQPLGYTFVDTFAALAAASLLVLTVFPTRRGGYTWAAAAFEWRPIVYLGIVSYSVYLWHIPVIWWLQKNGFAFGDSIGGFALNALVVSAISLVLATGSYFLVEKQALKLKRRTDSRKAAPVPSNG